jgi:hypothetical protein
VREGLSGTYEFLAGNRSFIPQVQERRRWLASAG